jgi:hypothetical protein
LLIQAQSVLLNPRRLLHLAHTLALGGLSLAWLRLLLVSSFVRYLGLGLGLGRNLLTHPAMLSCTPHFSLCPHRP